MHTLLEAGVKAVCSAVISQGIKAAIPDRSAKELNCLNLEVQKLSRITGRDKSETQSAIHKIAKKDLLTCVSYQSEGLAFLREVMDNINASTAQEHSVLQAIHVVSKESNFEVSLDSFIDVLRKLSQLKWHDLDESISRCLLNAKMRFQDARKEATKAFNNEVLAPEERLMAVRYRVLATILESMDHPGDAILACRVCLEELHSHPFVTASFTEFRDKIRHLNRIVCELTQSFGTRGALLCWPCVEVAGKKIDPRMSYRKKRCICYQFGQDGEHNQKIKHAWDITSNSRGEFIVADSEDRNVKVFDCRGKFLHILDPFNHEAKTEAQNETILEIWNVAADRKDDVIYILGLDRNTEYFLAISKVFVYSKTYEFLYSFVLLDGFRGRSMTADNNMIFISGGEFTKFHKNNRVHQYDTDGKFVQSFGKGVIEHAVDICTADPGEIFVLDRGVGVIVFNKAGVPVNQFKQFTINFGAIAYHSITQTIFVSSLSENSPVITVYSKDGKYKRKINFADKQGIPITTGMSVSPLARIAVTAKDLVLFV